MSSVCVLAVEDERIVARDLKNRLVDLGYRVMALAASAEEALALAQVQLPHVVLMDVRLAGDQDGIDAAHEFRERFDIPVVFSTAHSDDETLDRARQSEPYGYLIKPYGDRDLKAAIDIAIYKHRSEKQLRETNERLRLSQKVAQLGIWVQDLKSKFIEVSEEASRILDLKGKPGAAPESLFQKVDPVDRIGIETAIQKCANEAVPMQIEFQLDLGNGVTRFVRQYGEVVESKDGQRIRLLAAVQDVTPYKILEEKLRRSQKLEAIGQLAGGIAHDFNNLLIVVQGYSDMILQSCEPGHPIHSRIQQIRKAADRAAALTHQLLAFSGRQAMRAQVFDLNQLILDFESMLRRLIVESVDIKKVLAEELWAIRADPDQIEQVIMNLVLNARDAMPNGGVVVIETTNFELGEAQRRGFAELGPGRYVCLSVADNGIGISAEIQSRLFEPFFTTKGPSQGTGLGLSTAYGIVKQHKGEIAVESEPGRGSIFRVYLPATEEPVGPLEVFTRSAPYRKGSETVLLVEDEQPVRDLVADILRLNGYQVLLASNGKEALQIAGAMNGPIHLLVTDVVMPGMDGLELSRRLTSKRPDIRVILMSGYAGPIISREEVSGETFFFLPKPFGLLELKRKIEEALA